MAGTRTVIEILSDAIDNIKTVADCGLDENNSNLLTKSIDELSEVHAHLDRLSKKLLFDNLTKRD